VKLHVNYVVNFHILNFVLINSVTAVIIIIITCYNNVYFVNDNL
jgi:hypothetical protein